MNKIFITLISLILFVSTSYAQEVCNDGIDNDGDGFIDCFDSECSENSDCDGFYIGNDASCEAVPSQFPVFSLSLGFKSPNDVTNHLSRIAIGDLDRDGIPEIATQNRYTDRVYLLNGTDGSIKAEATLPSPLWRMSIANLEDDNCGEVFSVQSRCLARDRRGRCVDNEYKIVALDCNLSELWKSERLTGEPVHLGHADFDRDGKPEMYYKDEIRDPITGTRLIASTETNWNNIGGGPVAVDILGNEDLELILNNKIYSVNLGSRAEDAGSLTLLKTMPGSYGVKNGGQSATTSVADYNLDGYLDVLVTGADENNITTVFFWDVQNNTVKTFNDRIDENNYRNGWRNGTGRINIGDLDGDGQLNAVFVSGKYLYALDENWEPLWRDAVGNPTPTVVNEETSGITGCTLFDFNGDGKMEVVYRDEDYLYIVNGTNGSIGKPVHCRSRTNVEYPIVADVDADGSTEICVVCASENSFSGSSGANLGLNTPAEVRIYKSGGEPWVPARRLWNQHGYFNVNINDDLTVPRNQQKHQLVWSTGSCTTGPSRPLNGFLNQSPFLNSDGCPTYASPDLSIVENSLTINQPSCPETDFTISFDFENIGDVAISGSVPISFYDGDPLVAGTNKLGTQFITLNNFNVGQISSAVDIPVSGNGSQFTLYAVLNDNGSSVPTPITIPNTNFLECDYGNNIVFAEVNPIPFQLITEKTPNITCSAGSISPNGSVRVYSIINGIDQTADNDFFWFNGTDVSGTPDYTGSIYTGLSAGTYSVYAIHKLAACSSDTVQVVVEDSTTSISAEITVERPNNKCDSPYNGKLSVAVNGGEAVGKFTYEWYIGNTVGGGLIISKSHTATALAAATYTVLVTEKATGCQTIESKEVPDDAPIPIVDATAVDIVCSDLNSGSVSASVGGVTSGYTFEWFIGVSEKPKADFTGSTVSNLPKGSYTVIVKDINSKCESAPITVNINQSLAPSINGISSTNNNSCDSNLPNGSVSVSIDGNPADHTIEWFSGSTSTTSVIGTGLTLNGLSAGEYTVRLTNDNTGCFVTDKISVLNNIVKPSVSLAVEPVTMCSPFNGRVTASVDVDSESDYTFSWYSGEVVKSTPDFSETTNVLSDLEPGFYTVQAFHNTRNCLTDAKTIEVIDQATIVITQTDAVISLPSDCQTSDGVLQVEVNSPNNTSGFRIEWYTGTSTAGIPFLTETGVSTSQASNLTSGLYTVLAIDLDNGCSNPKIFDLPYVDSHALTTEAVVNTTTCIPNNDGAITVKLTPTSLAGFDESNYEIRLYRNNDINATPEASQAGVAGVVDYSFNGLSSGSYTIQALADAALGNCSVYSFAEIEMETTDPIISMVSNVPNINCSVAAATGTIEINIDGGASASAYTINWYEGDGTSTPLGTTTGVIAGVNGEVVNNLIGGNYTVEVFNNATQCSSIATYSLIDNPTIVTISSNDLVIIPISRCDVVNSEVTISNVKENGSTANMGNYIFEWYDESMNLLPSPLSPNTTNSFSGLGVGTYYVKAINTLTACSTSLNEFQIENEVVEPIISLDFMNPERCAIPSSGELHVLATGPASSYSYNWYNGNTASGTVAQTGPDFIGLSEGAYTVEITDNTSNCVYTETYQLVTEINELNIVASATPVNNCDSPDGTVFSTVTSPGDYTYTWIDTNGNTIGTGKDVTTLAEGDYTVIAVDNNDAFCQSTATVTITNEQQFPSLMVNQIAPLSVCDLNNANGAARATVDGNYVGYTFDWFEGSSATGTILYTGPEFSKMKDVTYTVRVTDNISQCSSEQSILVSSDIPSVDDPIIELIAQDTHCEIDNGILRAIVNEGNGNFIYNWYVGDQVKNTPDFIGERFSGLGAGQYTVEAINVTTGCVSSPVSSEISENLEYPEFEFKIEGVKCDESNGFASIILANDLEIKTIEWSDSNGNLITVGPNLYGVPAGDYDVYIETAMGCSVEDQVTIPTEINPFNGISRNGDSRNSYFRIDCISDFPTNIVKIYNRAGTLVYEVQGYDNDSKMFDGVSNKGINIMGTEVPDGTYFYVIDKNNGSKPVTGYLEIVN